MYESMWASGAGIAGVLWVSGGGAILLLVVAALLVFLGYGLGSLAARAKAPVDTEPTEEV